MNNFDIINIIQIGCGGTGSFLFPHITRFLSNIRRRNNEVQIFYTICDDDFVESRNILRQNFHKLNIGRLKTKSLLTNNYLFNLKKIGFKIFTINKRFKSLKSFDKLITDHISFHSTGINIIIGCVDNNKSRRIIYKWITDDRVCEINTIYLDSGNNLYNGQIVCTISNGARNMFLNGESFENINFLKYFKLADDKKQTQSCAFFGDQSHSMNLMSSTLLFCHIQKILIERRLPPSIVNFNNGGFSTFEI